MDSKPAGAVPWVPDSLEGEVELDKLAGEFRYVVVEEILEDRVRTIVSAWPYVMPDGQLRFDDPEASGEHADDRAELERLLAEARIVRIRTDQPTLRQLRERPLVTGDVFAMSVGGRRDAGGGGGGGGPTDGSDNDSSGGLREALEREEDVYDISLEARLAAKAAYWSAIAGPLDPDDAERFFDFGEGTGQDDEPPPRGGGPAPTGSDSGSGGGKDQKKPPEKLKSLAAVAGQVEQEQEERELAGTS